MRWLAVVLAALSLSGLAGAAGAAGVPPFPRLPGTWSHAEINVTLNKKPHTLSLDRGKITKVSGTQLTLREKTGDVVSIVVGAAVGVGDRHHRRRPVDDLLAAGRR